MKRNVVKLYVEGGGDSTVLKAACRQGFSRFLEQAGLKGKMPRVVACGSRYNAFDSFCTAVENGEYAFMLVDSEDPVDPKHQPGDNNKKEDRKLWLPWQHLEQRDGWEQPTGTQDLQCHLMVQCMESWFLADPDNLSEFFGQQFNENALPTIGSTRPLEAITKQQTYQSLTNATRNCKTKSQYNKGEHSFQILALLDPDKILLASPWAIRFVETLQDKMSE